MLLECGGLMGDRVRLGHAFTRHDPQRVRGVEALTVGQLVAQLETYVTDGPSQQLPIAASAKDNNDATGFAHMLTDLHSTTIAKSDDDRGAALCRVVRRGGVMALQLR